MVGAGAEKTLAIELYYMSILQSRLIKQTSKLWLETKFLFRAPNKSR